MPGLAEKLSTSSGIGFVLARSINGTALCYWRGNCFSLTQDNPAPFAGRADAVSVVEGLVGLMKMPSAGDLVVFGTNTAEGMVSFISEHGALAGPARDGMQTFIICPVSAALPQTITHPTQMYDVFIGYQK